MLTAHLIRHRKLRRYTLGYLVVDGVRFATLERPWLKNKANVSCIPEGEYEVVWLKQSASGKYKNTFHILGVEGRVGILIHNGNFVTHTKGCILLGTKHGILGGNRAVLNSKVAMSRLNKIVNKQKFILKVA